MKYLCILLIILVAGCTTAPKSFKQSLVLAATTYEASVQAAIAYASLPRCIPDGPIICSEEKIVEQMQRASMVAAIALNQAFDIASDDTKTESIKNSALSAVDAAIATLSEIVRQYKVN